LKAQTRAKYSIWSSKPERMFQLRGNGGQSISPLGECKLSHRQFTPGKQLTPAFPGGHFLEGRTSL